VNSLDDPSGTLDYYSFSVPIAGSTIYVDVDCGDASNTGCEGYRGGLDSWIEVYDPSGTRVAFNDDSGWDTGSEFSTFDSYLEVVAPEPGLWTIAVGTYPDLSPIDPGADYIVHVPEPPGQAGLITGILALGLLYRRR